MFEEVAPISPISWFSLSVPLPKLEKKEDLFGKKTLLFSPSDITSEEEFASIHAAFSEKTLYFRIVVKESPTESYFPDFRKGDSVELFIDTKDVKTRRQFSAFCHHFVFFPEKVEGYFAREVSRFRGEESHPLVNPEDLQVKVDIQSKSYSLLIEIPDYCLHGFDPIQFHRIGFTYQINRYQKDPQYFSVSFLDFLPEKNPHLWASLHLVNH